MGAWERSLFTIAILLIIALAATAVALLRQSHFGRGALLAAFGQAFAVLGAAAFALWLMRRSYGRR